MFTNHGLHAFVGAWHDIVKGCRFIVGGAAYDVVFQVDEGYPKFGDTDAANSGRGTEVYTWRFTVKRGESWGPTPAESVQLVDGSGAILLQRALPEAFRTTQANASCFYYNVYLRRM